MDDRRTIIRLNIDRFRRLLATDLDGATRRTVERLLAEAKADLDAEDDRSAQAD